ncbi:beta-1,3-galactosyltransferase 1-like [Daphnia pulicaria]|uniref:beta-1,3-galactosyltransferase 1-like n=1 Tax=Daphnia pulicaria TaxID=35523 RepID=UPI001EEB784B|nr:beta-1,3-galactosyltransferase 1-like [Daphnia pulicaria]XP_046649055.1 beta-1,3-galactosyltransferase 1-like [Daphnia pulicaria]
MIGKFIFVSLCLTVFVQLLPSGSSPRKEQIPAVGQKLFGLGCHNEKKRIDQLIGTIDALKKVPAKDTIADMENALRRERAKNQELQVLVEKLTKNLELCDDKRKMFNNYVLDSFLRNSPYSGVENYTRYAVARLGMLPIKNAKPLIPKFGTVINDVLSFRYPINIPSCPAAEITNNTWSNPSVFIAIISAPEHFKERNDIRETWLIHLKSALEKNLLGISTRFGFFLGQTRNDSIQKRIEEENQKHGDIVQIEMDDSYRNLTLKGIAVLNWVRQQCAKVDLVFKVDDDVYVNVHNLVHFVRSNYQLNNSLFGYGNFGFYPIRMPGYPEDYAKWDMTFEQYPWSHYPNYVNGPAYFMHSSVVIPLLAASQTTPLIPFEDVFLTGMCTEKAGVKMRYSAGTHSVFYRPLPTVPPPCDLRKFVGWPTDNQFVTHSAVDDFYRNKTQCVVTESDGTKKTIDFTAPVVFKFT